MDRISRMEGTEERNNELDSRIIETTESKLQRENRWWVGKNKTEQRLRDLLDNKSSDIVLSKS